MKQLSLIKVRKTARSRFLPPVFEQKAFNRLCAEWLVLNMASFERSKTEIF